MISKIPTVTRILLGLIFLVFGLNGFLNFIPMPPDLPTSVTDFMGAMMKTGYFFPFLKGTEVACGALLLLGVCVPVVLVILAPISIQIALFHTFLTPGLGNLTMPIIIIVLHLISATRYWNLYKPLFTSK